MEPWPETDVKVVVTPQTIETAMYGLPWKLEWLLVASLRAHDCEVVTLWSKMREWERVVKTLQDVMAIIQELITTEAEHCCGLQGIAEQRMEGTGMENGFDFHETFMGSQGTV